MGLEPALALPDGLLDLAAALESEWPARTAALRASGVPLNEGEETETTAEKETETAETETEDEPKTFDAAYVKKLRDEAAKHRREATAANARAQAFEDKDKTDAQKLEERATTAEQKATTAESSVLRLEVALDKAPEGMSIAQARKLAKRLTGSTREELEADAEELFADFKSTSSDERDSSRRPRERLRPGATSTEAEETDPAKLAEMVPRAY